MSPISGAILIFPRQRKTTVNVARKIVRHVVFRIIWARATARGFRSPAAARPSARRAPALSSPPAPRRPGQSARSSAPRRCPRGPGRLRAPGPPRGRAGAGGCPSHWAPGSPHPLPPPGRPRSRGEGGKGASGGQRTATNAGSATRAAPLPQRRWRRRCTGFTR